MTAPASEEGEGALERTLPNGLSPRDVVVSREEAARDRTELVHAVRVVLLHFLGVAPDRPRGVEGLAAAVRQLSEVLAAHHQEEEGRLFVFASRLLGERDPMLETLTDHHRTLEEHLARVERRLAAEGDLRAAAEEFRRFSARFESFTLVESDYFATLWDDLFPGEVSPG